MENNIMYIYIYISKKTYLPIYSSEHTHGTEYSQLQRGEISTNSLETTHVTITE